MGVLAACPRDRDPDADLAVDTLAADTIADLSTIVADLPPPEPDTLPQRTTQPRTRTPAQTSTPQPQPEIADAPPALQAAVQREMEASTFCYREFGLKSDPSLRGGVAMVVTVGPDGVRAARVGNSRWSSDQAGRAVNRCLAERAVQAWRVAPGAVSEGEYVVELTFAPS